MALSAIIAAEAASNALRAYGLGSQLGQYTIFAFDRQISLSGAGLVVLACGLAYGQAKCVWVAFSPGYLWRQRLIAAVFAPLLIAVSITALASHLLEAGRAKIGNEAGDAGVYRYTVAEHKRVSAELDRLKDARTTTQVRAAMDQVKVKPSIWEATMQCTDAELLKGKVNGEACSPILKLRQEMADAIRKTELETRLPELSAIVAGMKAPAAEPTNIEAAVAYWWAWLLGVACVLFASFGSVVLAKPVQIEAPRSLAIDEAESTTALTFEPLPADTTPADLEEFRKTVLGFGGQRVHQGAIAQALGISAGECSKRRQAAESAGLVKSERGDDRRFVYVTATPDEKIAAVN